MALENLRRRKPTQSCERCGLDYEVDLDRCPHCSDLDDKALGKLKKELQSQRTLRRLLAWYMVVFAILIALFLIALNK